MNVTLILTSKWLRMRFVFSQLSKNQSCVRQIFGSMQKSQKNKISSYNFCILREKIFFIIRHSFFSKILYCRNIWIFECKWSGFNVSSIWIFRRLFIFIFRNVTSYFVLHHYETLISFILFLCYASCISVPWSTVPLMTKSLIISYTY